MKKVIRNSVWETNSSSMHTVTVRGKKNVDYVRYNSPINGIIEVSLDEYGWSGPSCDTFKSKLKYALLMVLLTEYPSFNYYDESFVVDQSVLEECQGYKDILDAVRKHQDCDFILIKRHNNSYYPYGYIDHQSYEDYNSLKDFLDDWNVDIERFLFDDGVVVHIDNDNHY